MRSRLKSGRRNSFGWLNSKFPFAHGPGAAYFVDFLSDFCMNKPFLDRLRKDSGM